MARGGRAVWLQATYTPIFDMAERQFKIVKYANELQPLSGKAFCEALGISQAYGTEFTKMLKIAPRLRLAGMDQTRI